MKQTIKIPALFLSIFILVISSCRIDEKAQIINSGDFGFGKEKDCTPAALRMVKEAAKYSNSKIIIEKGTYHFYPDKAFQKYCYITNHDNGLRSTPFPLIDLSNIEIEADSAEFIFHGVMTPFIIENSENVKLSGFSIDWDLPLHSEVEVIAVDEINRSFDIKIDNNTPYFIRNGELLFLKEGFEHNLDRSICWDKETMADRKSTRLNSSHYS